MLSLLLEPAATISPFHHHGPRGVPPAYFTQFLVLPLSSCPAPFLYKQLFAKDCDSAGDHFFGGPASSRISAPASEGEGFLERKLVSAREERRTIIYLSLGKLGQLGTRCLPKPFHFTVIARTCQSSYSLLLRSQQGSGTQSSCNFTAPESSSNLSRLCWICNNLQENLLFFYSLLSVLLGMGQ